MILVDANLLIYARVKSMPQHIAARAWLEERLNASARVGLPWPTLLAFVRLVSNPRVFDRPDTIQAGWQQVEEWLERSCVWIPEPTDRHRETLARFLREVVDRPKLVADAHLAALAVEHGLTVCSSDGDFARFPGVRWENPLQARASA